MDYSLENLSEEDFTSLYNFRNIFLNYGSIYAYLAYNEFIEFPENEVVAELKIDKTDLQGQHYLKTTINNDETTIRRILNIIYESYKNGNIPSNKELIIDSELLNNNQVLDFIRKCYEEDLIDKINIVGENYLLTEEIYNKINYLKRIDVQNSEVFKQSIRIKKPKYKVIYGKNEDDEDEFDIILKENLTDNEINQLIINTLNNRKDVSLFNLDIRFYNPNKVVDLIERIDKLGLDKRVGIKLLGYTLTENSDIYKKLIPIAKKRNIEVQYVCCHDLLNQYTKEPFIVGNFYDSELEPSGKTNLESYIKILEFVENFEKSVDGINSNIEKIMTAYQFLNDNYHYDVDAGRTKNYGDTRDLDKILDTDQIVCTGYANLLCLMCRRVGIPMFTYDAPNHSVNIARVQEKDEKGNIILDKICTFDPTNDSGSYERNEETGEIEKKENKNSYTFFGLNPEETLHRIDYREENENVSYITLANSLSIQREDLINNVVYSASPYFGSYFSYYDPTAYMYSMLHLMGYNYNNLDTYILDVVAELQERGRIGEIPTDLIYNAAKNIEKRRHPEMTEEELNDYMNQINSNINTSINLRRVLYDMNSPARVNLNKLVTSEGEPYIVEVGTYANSVSNHNKVDIDSIDMGPVYYQEIDNLPTGGIETPEQEVNEPSEEIEEQEEIEDTSNQIEQVNEVIEPINDTQEEIDQVEDDIEETNESIEEIIYPEDIDLKELLSSHGIKINGNIHVAGNVRIIINNHGQDPDDLSNVTIAGTTIRRPKPIQEEETEEEYSERLDSYYEEYLPEAIEESKTTYRLTKNQIVQDLPIYSKEEQEFDTIGMTDEEIEERRSYLSL